MSTSDPGSTSGEPLRRRKRRDYSLLVLAAGIFLFGAVAAATYYVLRPVTLRVAVGPAGSDDEKLIKALAQAFTHEGSPVRLAPIVTEGTTESIAPLAASKADMAVARGDLDLPASATSWERLACCACSKPVFAAATSSGVKPSLSARVISSLIAASTLAAF